MSAYNEPQYVAVCKRVSAREMSQDREILKASANKREGLEHLVARYHEIGRQIEKEMTSKYPCDKTITAKFVKREEVAGILSRQGIVVQDQMDAGIVEKYRAMRTGILSSIQPTKQK